MKTINEFINANKIRITNEWADTNRNNPDWKDANHYKVVLKMDNRQLTTYFSQGYGISGEPTAESVLNCLASDTSGFENARNFEDWANEYGYDTDSRKAERIYRVIERQTKQLKRFLGDKYDELLYDTESL
ncbi:MAG: hypothetical protein M0R80_13715 [Proteobacteria bacterium]|jgi:hypothetical protein|nr:hypothetical protein [Pseudomonadota bacterium]